MRSTSATSMSEVDTLVPPVENRARIGSRADLQIAAAISVAAAVAFYFSITPTQREFDYTNRIAGAFLHGHLGLVAEPPSWLNEMIPMNGRFYSVFPLGAVLTVMPIALLQRLHLLKSFPAAPVTAVITGATVW